MARCSRVVGLQQVRQLRRTGGAIALAEQEFRRLPAAIFVEEFGDEFGEGVAIGVDAPESLFLVRAGDAREAGAGGVDEHQIRGIKQALVIGRHLVGGSRQMLVAIGDDTARTEGAHMQPHGRRARPAIIDEGHRAVLGAGVLLEIGDIEHRSLGRGFVLGLVVAALSLDRRVLPALGMHDQRAGHGLVVHLLVIGDDAAFGDLFLGLEIMGAGGGLVVRLIRRLVGGEGGRGGQQADQGG
jgi:hypothetical protein